MKILFAIALLLGATLAVAGEAGGGDCMAKVDGQWKLGIQRPGKCEPYAAAMPTMNDADAAYRRGDYPTAGRILRHFADLGDATAQYDLGLLYENPKGAQHDYPQAAFWYRKAADQRDAGGELGLGIMYAGGWGVPQDYRLARMYFNLALSHAKDSETRDLAIVNLDSIPDTPSNRQALPPPPPFDPGPTPPTACTTYGQPEYGVTVTCQ